MSASFSVQYIFHLIDRFTPGATAMAGAATKLQGALAAAGAAMAPLIARMAALGAAVAVVGGAFILGGVRKAARFEEALTGLRRVANLSREEMLAYGKDALKVSVTTGRTGVEIANIMQEGALMGVRGQKVMKSYAETVAKLAVVWDDISHREAAQGLASIQAKFFADLAPDEAIKRLDQVADSMNELSNRSPFKAPELLKFMSGAAPAGRDFGLSAEQLAAFGGASMVLGENSGAKQATRAIMTFTKLQQAAANPLPKQIQAIRAIGYKPGEFEKRMRDNPQLFLLDFFGRLEKMDPLKRSTAIMDLVTVKSMRQMKSLANNLNEYKRQLVISDKAMAAHLKNDEKFMEWLKNGSEGMRQLYDQLKNHGDIISRNGSVEREFQNYMEALNRAVAQLSAAWDRLRITMSMPLLGPLRHATNWLTGLVSGMADMAEYSKLAGVTMMTGLVAGVTALSAAAGAGVAKLLGFTTAAQNLWTVAAIAGKVTLWLTVVTVGIASAMWIYDNWEKLREYVQNPLTFSINWPDAPGWVKWLFDPKGGGAGQWEFDRRNDPVANKEIMKDSWWRRMFNLQEPPPSDDWYAQQLARIRGMQTGLPALPPNAGMPLPAPNPERLHIESQVKGQIDPLQVQIQTPGSVQLTLPNGMVAGSVPVGATSNAPRGVSTQEAGSSVVAP